MKQKKLVLIVCAVAGCLLLVTACGEQAPPPSPQTKAAPAKTAPPAMEQPAVAQPALEPPAAESPDDLLKIREAALKEKDLIMAKKDELQTLLDEKSSAPLTAQLGEAQQSTQQIASLKEAIQQATARYNEYIAKLKAGNVDTSDLLLE
jgi:hypothetical protein